MVMMKTTQPGTALTGENLPKLQPKSGYLKRKSKEVWRHRYLFLMLFPGVIMILLFRYGPIYGLQIAFKEYRIIDGIWGSPWVGFKHFIAFFTTAKTLEILRNTVLISLYRLIIGFPAPILFALMLNEINNFAFKKVAQTISYLPHFISWVIIAGIVTKLLSPSTGVVNQMITAFGGEPIFFMVSKKWFRTKAEETNGCRRQVPFMK